MPLPFLTLAPLLLVQSAPERAEAWSADILHVVEELERMHPDPFFAVPREEFEGAVDGLLGRLGELDDAATTIELMRLMATLSRAGREGHATVWPMRAHYLPVQLYLFEDGWFVVRADGQPEWTGARVAALGGLAPETVCERLTPLLTFDNEWSLRQKLALALTVPELLSGVGVPLEDGAVRLELARAGRPNEGVLLKGGGFDPGRFAQLLPQRGGARWLTGRDEAYRMEVLVPERALYVQFNEVTARSGERTLADFAAELVRTFEREKLERVVVDVRSNGGGDNTTFGPLIQALQTPAINVRGRLFGLTGRATFSAAGNFVTVLERDTEALLVGEPTGGAPNQYGDAREVELASHPEVMVRIATRYHAFGGPADARLTHVPALAVPLASAGYFAGRDLVLTRALAYR